MARRKNATFTLDKTYGSGHGDRTLIQAFYRKLDELYPGDTPIPIPPESQIHPKHDVDTQMLIFADFAVRKITPIAFRATRVAGLARHAATLEQLDPITDQESAAYAAAAYAVDAAYAYAAYAVDAADDDFNRRRSLRRRLTLDAAEAAHAVAQAASLSVYFAKTKVYADDAAYDVAYHATNAARNAADALDPNATWEAVNEMLQAL